MEKEIWKKLPSIWGDYSVSNLGNLMSESKSWLSGRKGHLTTRKPKLLKPYKDPRGYKYYRLFNNCQSRYVGIHQLMAIAFLNHKADDRNIVIDHIDSDKSNNVLSNIQIISIRDNILKEKINNKSKLIGAHYDKNKKMYTSTITKDKKRYYLGCFETELEAHKAYKNKENELYNELN